MTRSPRWSGSGPARRAVRRRSRPRSSRVLLAGPAGAGPVALHLVVTEPDGVAGAGLDVTRDLAAVKKPLDAAGRLALLQPPDLVAGLGARARGRERLAGALGQGSQERELLGGGLHGLLRVVGIEHDPATARPASERTRQVPAGTAGASHAPARNLAWRIAGRSGSLRRARDPPPGGTETTPARAPTPTSSSTARDHSSAVWRRPSRRSWSTPGGAGRGTAAFSQ